MPENTSARVTPAWQRIVSALANIAARWGIIALTALLPFFIIPVSWILVEQTKVVILASFISITLIVWIVARLCELGLHLPKNILLLFASFLPIAYAVSALASGASIASFVSGSAEQDTVVGVCMFYTLMMLTALAVSRKESAFSRVLQAFLLGSGILVLFQMARLVVPTLTLGGALQGSTATLIGSWHDLGIVLGLAVFLAVALYGTPLATGFWKWFGMMIGFLAYAMLFIVNVADVWYTLAAVIFVYGAYRFFIAAVRDQLSFTASLGRTRLWAIVLVVIVISLLASPSVYARLPSPLHITNTEVRPSWEGTLAIGEKVLSGKSGFIFGSGPNTFAQQWGRFKPASVNSTLFWNVNFAGGVGIVPTAFITVGAFGIVAWLLIVAGLLWSAWRFFSDRNSLAPPGRAYTGAALFSSVYLMAFLVLYVPGTAVVALAFLFFGLLAALEIARDRKDAIVFMFGFRRWYEALYLAVFIALVVLLLFASTTALRASSSNMLLGRASLYASAGDTMDAGMTVQRAISIFPENDNAQRFAVQLGLSRLSTLIASGSTDDAAKAELQSTLSATIQHGLAAVSIDGGDYQNWLSLASLYQKLAGVGVQGAFDNAKKAYSRAIAENPTDPLLLTQLAQLQMSQNDVAGASDSLNTALALKKDFPAALYFRSQLEVSQRDFVAAEADAAAAADLASADPLGWYNLGSTYYAAGDYGSAATSLEHAVSLQGNYADALYMLGLTYAKMGRTVDAITRLQQVASLNPGNTVVTSALQSLENMSTTATSSAPQTSL